MDLLRQFSDSSTGKWWGAVAVDYATRYAVRMSLLTGTALDVANFLLQDVLFKHGAPRGLLSDRGQLFTSRVVTEVL